MEIKVWVEGVVRVVCGISQTTSCQDVVISLAQAIGQTGRYVLVLKFRDTERPLGADECPLQHLNKLGQFAGEVQFILHRTGPSLSAGQDQTTRVIHPALLKPPKPESIKHRRPKKALTFSLGPSTAPRRTQSNRAWSPCPRTSPEPRASLLDSHNTIQCDGAPSSKEEVFRQILQQQMMLKDLEIELQALEDDTEWREQEMANTAISAWNSEATDELTRLEQLFRHNEAELMMSQLWGESLQEEIDREEDLQSRLNYVQSSVEDQSSRIEELLDLFAHLQSDIGTSQVDTQVEILKPLKQELKQRVQQGEELNDTLSKTSRDLQAAEERLRMGDG
uniref:ras association domain-containing protein 8-like isoform X2 n=1 Tax=Doryrhamphus excisus TaxID=161450 RepID=UPI0025AE4529|nr:ras association domain-containing protein 8-like isoform X2 [Doryrhamphus excisus]